MNYRYGACTSQHLHKTVKILGQNPNEFQDYILRSVPYASARWVAPERCYAKMSCSLLWLN